MSNLKCILIFFFLITSYFASATSKVERLLRHAVTQIHKSRASILFEMGNKFLDGIDSSHVGRWYSVGDLGQISYLVYEKKAHFNDSPEFNYYVKYYFSKEYGVFQVEMIFPMSEYEKVVSRLDKDYFKVFNLFWMDTKKKYPTRAHDIYINIVGSNCVVNYKNDVQIE